MKRGQRLKSRYPVWGARLLWLLSRSVRTRIVGFEKTESFPNVGFAHWHGDEMALLPRFNNRGITVLVSHSKDGEIMARAAETLGYRVTRGSSSRGAVGGLLALIKSVRAGHSAVLAVDGPKGPRGRCKPGIVHLAARTGVPLFPVGVAVTRKYIFKKTWNQVYLPLPLARQVIFFGEPLSFSREEIDGDIESHCRRVEAALREAAGQARVLLDMNR